MRRIMIALLVVSLLASTSLLTAPASVARAAPPGYALPFYGTFPILEGPDDADQADMPDNARDAEGIVFGLPVRTEVRAAQEGTVVFAGWQRRADGYLGRPLGVVLHLRHDDGTVSEYGYLNDVDVPLGATVYRGDFVAHSGATGETDRPALYFAILIDTDGTGFDGRSVSIRDLPGLDWEQMRAVGSGEVLPVRNLARGAAVWASSTDGDQHGPGQAVDGDTTTRYASAHRRQPETLGIILPGRRVVTRVVVAWEEARPKTWSVWVAAPGDDGLLQSRQVWRTSEWANEAQFAAVDAFAVMIRGEDHWEYGWANISLFEVEVEGF
jgi:hypothetical protein